MNVERVARLGQNANAVAAFRSGQSTSRLIGRWGVGRSKRPGLWETWAAPIGGAVSAALLFGAIVIVALPAVALAGIPQGVWLMDSKVAVQIFNCSNLLCGRILWMKIPRDPQGRPERDELNPNPTLRQRPLCGVTIIGGLRSTGPDDWGGGWFYNPMDGVTYSLSAEVTSADLIVARIYIGIPLFGTTKTLVRVAHGISDGWC